MKLSDLITETPQLRKTELQANMGVPGFVSDETIAELYDIVFEGQDLLYKDKKAVVLIKKSKSVAIIGVRGERHPGKTGVKILGHVDFKHKLNVHGILHVKMPDNVLQVDIVNVSENIQRAGYGMFLYMALASKNFVVISDNTQYLGGQALWKSLSVAAPFKELRVIVIDNNEVRSNEAGEPIVYDGNNIPDNELWSKNSDKKYTLFVLLKKDELYSGK